MASDWSRHSWLTVTDPRSKLGRAAQLISVGPYKVDVLHAQKMTKQQLGEYAEGRLDFVALAHKTTVALNRPGDEAKRV